MKSTDRWTAGGMVTAVRGESSPRASIAASETIMTKRNPVRFKSPPSIPRRPCFVRYQRTNWARIRGYGESAQSVPLQLLRQRASEMDGQVPGLRNVGQLTGIQDADPRCPCRRPCAVGRKSANG